ncbi:MAG: polysaccharide biosynthesis tyrosine autokinase [Ignavibacteriae bacterium]|nr:polysaccharide biosynthesis tyrosine autokinase [Ignavibacteriota bacterium]
MELNSLQKTISSNIHLKRRLALLQKKKWNILVLFLGGGFLAALVSFFMPKEYQSNSTIIFKYNSVNNNLLNNPGSLSNEISLLNSDILYENAQNSLTIQGININLNELKNSTEVDEENLSTGFEINSVSDEAEKSAQIANAVATSFSEECILNDKSSYLFLLKSLSDREKILQNELKSSQLTSNPLSASDDLTVTQISEFESELEGADLENQYFQMQKTKISQVLENRFPQIITDVTNINNSSFLDLKQKIEIIEIQNYVDPVLQKLRGFDFSYPWDPSDYDAKQLENYKSNFNSLLSSTLDDIIEKNNIKDGEFLKRITSKFYEKEIKLNAIGQVQSIIFEIMTSLEEKFNLIPFEMIESARKLRGKRFTNNLNIKIKNKIENLKSTESKYYAEIESIRKAEVPEDYVSPNIAKNIFLGLLFGLIAAIIFVLRGKTQDIDIVNSAQEIEDSGYKIIAQFDHLETTEPVIIDLVNQNEEEFHHGKLAHSLANIQAYFKYGNLERPLKTILVTSNNAEEGKSIVAANIAVFLANNNNRVLLVDADLIKPDQSKIFKIKSTPSLAHYLFRKKELDEIIRNTHLKNLDIITCIEFPQNPSVIITSERMKSFMDLVKDMYDFVIYDSASLCSLKEITFVGQNVDETILVVRANKTKFSEIADSQLLLAENGISNFDIILNDVYVN